MPEALLSGVAFGLTAGLAPGPLQALIISETLRHGRVSGMKVGLAPLLSDLPIVTIALLLLDRLDDTSRLLGTLALVGAGFLLYLAVENFRAPAVSSAPGEAVVARPFLKGMLTNLLSPHPYLFWFTVGAPFMLRAADDHAAAPFAFAGGFYLTLLGCFLGLALLVFGSRSRLTGRAYRTVLRLLGFVLLVFAVLLARHGLGLIGAA